MKHYSIILGIAALSMTFAACNNTNNGNQATSESAVESTAPKGAIVYFNLDDVLSEYDMANELRSAVESKVQSINEEVNRRAQKLQKDVNSFQEKIDKGLMTRSTAEVQSQKLQQQENEFNQYAAQKQQEIAEEQQVMLNQIGDAINSFLVKYNEEKKFALIISTQGDVLPSPVVTGDPSLNITEEIIAGLNEEYVKAKAK